MANSKISGLSSASTPLAGTETLPISQAGATVKVPTNDLTVRNIRAVATTGILQVSGPSAATTRTVTVPDANWTAARTDAAQSFTGDQTLSTGNLVQGTAAKGINFTANTPASGMTSQLLNWYEEGTWTPTVAGDATGVINTQSGQYTKIGNFVYFRCVFAVSTNFTASSIGGLPFTCTVNNGLTGLAGGATVLTASSVSAPIIATPLNGSTNINFYANASTSTPHTPNTVNSVYRINGFYFT